MLIMLFLIFILIIGKYYAYYIVKSGYGDIHSPGKKMYLLNRGEATHIPDNETVKYLGFDPENLHHISLSVLNTFHIKPNATVPKIHVPKMGPDECMEAELLKINTIQKNLLYGFHKLGEYINPAVIKWKNRLFLGCGLAWGFIAGKPANEHLEFQWINSSYLPFSSSEKYIGISSSISEINNTVIVGQDPRFLVVNPNKIFVAYTNRFGHHIRMGMAEIELIDHESKAIVKNVYGTIIPPGDQNKAQKNWSPFLYNKSVLMIQNINPLHVVSLDDYSKGPINDFHAHTFSLARQIPLKWGHGDIRGGTNAILVGDVYLSLFHSSAQIHGNWLKTYWMGAYTFTVSISPVPIVSNFLYNGAWDPLKNRKIDYCVFPMSLTLESDDVLLVSFGRNDHEGWIANMNLHSLLDSLDPVPKLKTR